MDTLSSFANKTENKSKDALDQSEIYAKCKIVYSADMCKVILHDVAPCIILHIVWSLRVA